MHLYNTLLVIAVLAVFVAALTGLASWSASMFTQAQQLRGDERRHRKALRRNINELIVELSYADEHESASWLLREALTATIAEYRACS